MQDVSAKLGTQRAPEIVINSISNFQYILFKTSEF